MRHLESSEGLPRWEEETEARKIANKETENAVEALLEGQVGAFNMWRVKHPEVRIDLRNSDLEGRALEGALLFRCDLSGANLRNSDLRRATLAETSAQLADFGGADLSEAQMISVDFAATNFRAAILRGSRLLLCRFSGSLLQAADLSGIRCELPCDFRRANLEGATIDRELSEITRLSLAGDAM